MIDVYVCHDIQHAERVADILREAGIEPLLRDRSSTPFPTAVGLMAERRIAVHADGATQARETIRAAIDDGIIGSEGEIVG